MQEVQRHFSEGRDLTLVVLDAFAVTKLCLLSFLRHSSSHSLKSSSSDEDAIARRTSTRDGPAIVSVSVCTLDICSFAVKFVLFV